MSKFKVGDKVRIVCDYVWEPEHGREAVIKEAPGDNTFLVQRPGDSFGWWYVEDNLELIGEMKLWQDMTQEEKGALLLAHHEGKVIEFSDGYSWNPITKPSWSNTLAYRVSPEPVVTIQTLFGGYNRGYNSTGFYTNRYHDATYKITFNVVDGEPDVTSIKMEKL